MNINIDYSRTINRNRREDENKNCWSRRSALERYLSVALIIVGALSLGYFLYLATTTTVAKANVKICFTEGCLTAASEIISRIDREIDPCDDFLKFSCGKLIENAHGEEASRSVPEALFEFQMREIIEAPVDEDDHRLIKAQKELFAACMNKTGVEEGSLEVLERDLGEIDGWPVVVGHRWLARRFDWKDLVYELKNRGYEYNSLVRLTLVQDFDEGNRFVIAINPPSLPEITNRNLYKKYMVDVAIAFGAEENLAKNEMEKVLEFMEKLKFIIDDNQSNFSWNILTIEEFQNNDDEVDWLDFINAIIFPVEGLISEDRLVFPGFKYMQDLLELLHRTKKRTQANYLIWRVIEDIMYYLPRQIKQIHTSYTCLLNDQLGSSVDQFELCKNLIEKKFYPKTTEIMYAKKYLPVDKREQVRDLYDHVKIELSKIVEDTTWLDEESKERLLEKAKTTRAALGFQRNYFNDTFLDEFSPDWDVSSNVTNTNLLSMYLKASRQFFNTFYSLIYVPVNESFYESEINGVQYDSYANTLIIKASDLQGIVYKSNRPAFMNYGSLGYKISTEIIKGFYPYGSEFDRNDNTSELWTNSTQGRFENELACFDKEVASFDEEKRKVLKSVSLRNTVGARLAYLAYQDWTINNFEEDQLPGIDYTPNQLFWVASMLPQCEDLTENPSEEDVIRLTASVRHNWEFAENFGCTKDSKMNPSKKCNIY